MTQRENLERAYRRQVRNLEDEVHFLRSLLWQETQGTHPVFDQPEVIIPIQTRKEETVAPSPVDNFLKSMLEENP